MDRLNQLRSMLADGTFHHATYRNLNTLWEGLWIYQRSETGHRGFVPVLCFLKGDPELAQAEEMVRPTGISLGVYGGG